MRSVRAGLMLSAITGAALLAALGCGNPNVSFFNDALTQFVSGGVVPSTPGPNAAFVFVRTVNNTTNTPIEFVVTVERTQVVRDEEGRPQADEFGNPVTEKVLETVRLQTFPVDKANELGHVFSCSDSVIERVGLGEKLLPTDQGLFLNSLAGNMPGFGVSAGIPPLVSAEGNFTCGDTIVFRAISAKGVPGGVKVQAFRLPFTNEPSTFTGPNTFGNLEAVLQSQSQTQGSTP